MTENRLKQIVGQLALLNDLKEKLYAELQPMKTIGNSESMALMQRDYDLCKRITRHNDRILKDRAIEFGEIYDAIEETINERVKYE